MWFLPYSDNNPTKTRPIMTQALIAVNVIVFLFTWHSPHYREVVQQYAYVPTHPSIVTIITYQFLHGGYMHLIGNMWFLWLFGDNIEDLVGKIAFIPFYLTCGIMAALLHSMFAGTGAGADVPTVGASGAVSGILGAYFVLFSRSSVYGMPMLFFFPIPFRIKVPAVFFLGLYIFMEIVQGVAPPGMAGVRVAHWAHIGGFIFGAGIIYLLVSTRAVIVPNLDRVRRGEYARISPEEQFVGKLGAAYEKKSYAGIPEQYRTLMEQRPNLVFEPDIQIKTAMAVQSAGDFPLAIDIYRRLMDSFPNHPSALKAGLDIAKIAAYKLHDRRAAAMYLDWVMNAPNAGGRATEAKAMMDKIFPGKLR